MRVFALICLNENIFMGKKGAIVTMKPLFDERTKVGLF